VHEPGGPARVEQSERSLQRQQHDGARTRLRDQRARADMPLIGAEPSQPTRPKLCAGCLLAESDPVKPGPDDFRHDAGGDPAKDQGHQEAEDRGYLVRYHVHQVRHGATPTPKARQPL
jgi:hypothetical protein